MPDISIAQVRERVRTWIEAFLSVPHPQFGGMPPCPFSRQAWLDDRVDVRLFAWDDLDPLLCELTQTWRDRHRTRDRYDVIIFACTSESLDPHALDRRVQQLNPHLAAADLVALVDCPANPATTVSHTTTSNRRYNLVLVQRLSHLQAASDRLFQTDYYQNWSERDFENLVNWRSQLLRTVRRNAHSRYP